MLIVLSHFGHPDDSIERRVAAGRADFFLQPFRREATEPLPMEIRARADAILHFPAGFGIDGAPSDYPRARAVLRSGVGFDNLDVAAWGARGVPVFNVPDYGTSEVADHALALMLSLTRGLATYDEDLRRVGMGAWSAPRAPLVRRLRGATFGVLGLGRIGLAAAMRARGFGMNVAFCDPHQPSGIEISIGARRVRSPVELFAISDVVSIHAPATAETTGLVDAAVLAAAKPGLVLVNTARGAIVDLDALFEALRSGRVGGAALDVLPREPADAAHPLIAAWSAREPWLAGRLTLTPHAAYYSPESLVDMRSFAVETLIAAVTGNSLANCVNLEHLRRVDAPA